MGTEFALVRAWGKIFFFSKKCQEWIWVSLCLCLVCYSLSWALHVQARLWCYSLTGIQSFPWIIFSPQVRRAVHHSCFLVHLSLLSSLHPKTPLKINLMHQGGSCNYHIFSSTCLGMQVCPLLPVGSCCFLPLASSCLQCSSPYTGKAALWVCGGTECSLSTESGA